jgi:hypothetical protein
LRKVKSRANNAYDVYLKSYHRRLKNKSGMLPHSSATSTLHKITRLDAIPVATSNDVIASVHSHFDTELTRATPPSFPSLCGNTPTIPTHSSSDPAGTPPSPSPT